MVNERTKPHNEVRTLNVEFIGNNRFELQENGIRVAALTYPSWFSFDADIELPHVAAYKMQPKGFWGTTIELKREEAVLLNFKMHWNGSIIVESHLDGRQRDFIFSAKSAFKSLFVLREKDGLQLILLQPHIRWRKFNYDYTIEMDEIYDTQELNNIMALVVVHCTNYFMNMMGM